MRDMGPVEDVPPGGMKSFVINDNLRVLVAQPDAGLFYAVEDLCTHADALLSPGWLEDRCVACPVHGARFDLRTGEALTPPAHGAVRTFPVDVVDGRVFLEVPEPE